jgi:hypothetical protein
MEGAQTHRAAPPYKSCTNTADTPQVWLKLTRKVPGAPAIPIWIWTQYGAFSGEKDKILWDSNMLGAT